MSGADKGDAEFAADSRRFIVEGSRYYLPSGGWLIFDVLSTYRGRSTHGIPRCKDERLQLAT